MSSLHAAAPSPGHSPAVGSVVVLGSVSLSVVPVLSTDGSVSDVGSLDVVVIDVIDVIDVVTEGSTVVVESVGSVVFPVVELSSLSSSSFVSVSEKQPTNANRQAVNRPRVE